MSDADKFHRPHLPVPPTIPPHLLAMQDEINAMWERQRRIERWSSFDSSRCTLQVTGYEGSRGEA